MHLPPQHAVVLAWAIAAAIADYRTGTIPNRLLISGAAAVLCVGVATAAADGGWPGLGARLLSLAFGLLACGAVPLALYLCGALGGGDVKLLALCGAGLGPVIGMQAELYAFTLGALLALGRAAYEGTLLEALTGSAALITNPLLPKKLRKPVAAGALRELRFGPAIAAGVGATLALHGVVS
jgi:prepilin peptidase CpaA